MIAENRNQLVRGYVVASSRFDEGPAAKDGPFGITAYTYWYRHDGDLAQLERDLDTLSRFYLKHPSCYGCQIGYEYKDYPR